MPTTFQELSRLWCIAKEPIVKYSTLCAYRLTLRTHLLPHFGDMTRIEEVQVQAFIIEKIRSGLSKKTVRDIIAVLRAVVKYGERLHLFEPENWQLDYPTTEHDNSLPVLSLNHHRKLMAHLKSEPNARNIGILLALCTGMRIGEVCALEWRDVDLTHRIIKVRQSIGRIYNCDKGSTERIVSSPKTKHSFREIPISKPLFVALSYVKKQKQSIYVVGISSQATDPRSYREYFSRILKRLHIPSIVFHGLRHTFATRCVESGADYKSISSILGHSNISTTLNLYVHPNLQQKKRCIDKMSRFLEVTS